MEGPLELEYSDIQNSAESLEYFLNDLISLMGEQLWFSEPLLLFLDNEPKRSFMTELKISKLLNQVRDFAVEFLALSLPAS